MIPPRVRANLRIPNNIRVTASQNGWMTGEKIAVWVNRVWGPNRDDVRRMIVLDRARIHTMQATQDLLEEKDTDCILVPAGCTSLAQPADVSWNAPFKRAMRECWKSYLIM